MKPNLKFLFLCTLSLTVGIPITSCAFDEKPLLNFAVSQYRTLSTQLKPTDFIHTGIPTHSQWETNALSKWTVGFYSGTLWMLYKLTGENYWRDLALAHSDAVKDRQYDVNTHDVGFVIHSSFGLALELSDPDSEYFQGIIVNASNSLSSRFHELSGCIRSWNNDADHGNETGEVKVIADNMMNLELLFIATEISGNTTFRDIAYSHALKTSAEHMRADGGSFHAVAYNETTGLVRRKYTWQGYANSSTWARGQAWLIHGFTTTYKLNQTLVFLETAEKAAQYFISHLPEDGIPYWDFNAPFDREYHPRDTSAAVIATSGLLDLYKITKNSTYLEAAERMLTALASPSYRADGNPAYKIPAIIVNGTVFFNEGNMNTAIVYGDYYLLQAIDRYINLKAQSNSGWNCKPCQTTFLLEFLSTYFIYFWLLNIESW